ncbi:hypothetical protein B0H19DRAFT_1059983 [Mycena capillaripes]|nr:hypothetical protein B0H19DRAFT_1059983 [Mycena capillaripes]
MQAKFASLSVVFSVLFIAQLVGAVPKYPDCSLVRCPVMECPFGQTAQIEPGTCCPTCVSCVLNRCYAGLLLFPTSPKNEPKIKGSSAAFHLPQGFSYANPLILCEKFQSSTQCGFSDARTVASAPAVVEMLSVH